LAKHKRTDEEECIVSEPRIAGVRAFKAETDTHPDAR
jgi:hypothetical protein